MAKMTKGDLRNGMFGIFDDEDDIFVIVNDKFVYREGFKDSLDLLNDELELPSGRKITKLYDASCFEEVKRGMAKLIWERPEEEDEPEVEPTKEGAIKITEDQFFEAVKKANEKFMEIGKGVPGTDAIEPLIGMQNILFGELIGAVLFGAEID